MGNFFRNAEMKRAVILMLLLSAILIAAGYMINSDAGFLVCIGCILFMIIFLGYTYNRYNQLKKLADRLDSMMHYQTPIPFEEYKEGELSILQSELSKMTNKLVEQAQRLQEDKSYLSDAMTDISHQLRSPLTSSQLILNFLMDSDITDERRMELLHELGQLLTHINWLIEAMLKMAKMDADTAYLKTERIKLIELVRKAAEPIMIPMELHNQILDMRIEDNIYVNVDTAWTCEAILNVLKNCMEHIDDGGCITVEARENNLYVEINVRDNGCGFEKEDLPHIFERFYKGKNSGSQSVGIGLALTKMIITSQNGTIKAENGSDGGALFNIRFYKGTTV